MMSSNVTSSSSTKQRDKTGFGTEPDKDVKRFGQGNPHVPGDGGNFDGEVFPLPGRELGPLAGDF